MHQYELITSSLVNLQFSSKLESKSKELECKSKELDVKTKQLESKVKLVEESRACADGLLEKVRFL